MQYTYLLLYLRRRAENALSPLERMVRDKVRTLGHYFGLAVVWMDTHMRACLRPHADSRVLIITRDRLTTERSTGCQTTVA